MPVKILVIDDEPLILTAVERALSRIGYSVTTARDMRQLAACLGSGPFALLITDIYMEDESVENVIERVRQSSPGVRVLKMSGSVAAKDAGHFIEKPFSIQALRACVREILDEPS